MEPVYILAESTVKPSTVEIETNTVYLRKDFKQENRTSRDTNVIYWSYQEAKLTPEEFNKYINVLTVGKTNELIDGQKNVDDNQLVIMEAFADLYDLIATML